MLKSNNYFLSRSEAVKIHHFLLFKFLPFSWLFFFSSRGALCFYRLSRSFLYLHNGKKWFKYKPSRWALGFKLFFFIFPIQPAIYKKRQLLKQKQKQAKKLNKQKIYERYKKSKKSR